MKVFCKKRFIANAKFSNGFGLMFKKKLKDKEGIILETLEGRLSSSIHMLFVFQTIDIIWLDKEWNIVDIKKNIKPFTLFVMPRKKANYILELSKANNLKIGDKLLIK
ncbi:MAG TPA: DUF192 domain-containing protein [Candidatus Nanoarchaeia archaeon]|nr:DUF192 domain-containing protein [Candidatus Nanoarchaeia archaeon]